MFVEGDRVTVRPSPTAMRPDRMHGTVAGMIGDCVVVVVYDRVYWQDCPGIVDVVHVDRCEYETP